jgi:prophage regulatory protein
LPFTSYQFITGRFDDAGSRWYPQANCAGNCGANTCKQAVDFLIARADIGTCGSLSFIQLLQRIELVRRVSKTQSVSNKRAPTSRPTTANECALRLPQVCKITGLRRSMIYQMQAEKRFPQRIKLTERAVGWLEREVQEWLAQRIENSRGKTPGSS